MKICYIGSYDPAYSRHKVLLRGLRAHGVEITEHRVEGRGYTFYKNLAGILRTVTSDTNFLLAAYSGELRFVWFLRLFSRKPIIWDAFFSLYDNWVHDRKLVSPRHPKAFYYWFLDWLCGASANRILLDTNTHISYFSRAFFLPRKKFIRVLVGSDPDVMYPREGTEEQGHFLVHFHGNYIPVQGAEHIVEAAKILEGENIKFNMIGKGQTYAAVRKRAEELQVSNVTFIDRVPFEELATYMAEAKLCLGLLGDVSRVDRAIPNKIYEASFMKRSSINADTSAIREIFEDGVDIVLCRRGDAEDLAEKILMLKNDAVLRERVAEGAYRKVREVALPEKIGGTLTADLKNMLTQS